VVAVCHDPKSDIAAMEKQTGDVVRQAGLGYPDTLLADKLGDVADRRGAQSEPIPFLAGDKNALRYGVPSGGWRWKRVGCRQSTRLGVPKDSFKPGGFTAEIRAMVQLFLNASHFSNARRSSEKDRDWVIREGPFTDKLSDAPAEKAGEFLQLEAVHRTPAHLDVGDGSALYAQSVRDLLLGESAVLPCRL
jgi:hypothetical protein